MCFNYYYCNFRHYNNLLDILIYRMTKNSNKQKLFFITYEIKYLDTLSNLITFVKIFDINRFCEIITIQI